MTNSAAGRATSDVTHLTNARQKMMYFIPGLITKHSSRHRALLLAIACI